MSEPDDQGTRVIPRSSAGSRPAAPSPPVTGEGARPPRDLARYLGLIGVDSKLSWPDAPQPRTGSATVGGRYRLLSELGRGGLGEVLLAWDEDLGRRVAFKRLQARHRQEPTLVQAFLEEAIITGRLESPHIVPIHDVGVSPDDGPYYTMKLLDGEPLSAILGRLRAGDAATTRAFSLSTRVELFVRILRGMAHAHERGIIHCDLKPSNVLIGALGEVTIVDWGLAIALGQNAGHQARAQMWSGSPGYMAPEQSLDGDVSRLGTAADIWSLGAILYELLCLCTPQADEHGRLDPDSGPGGDLTLPPEARWVPVRPLSTRPADELPPALVAACDKALSFEARERQPSVLALLQEAEGWLRGRQAEERRAARIEAARRRTARAIAEVRTASGDEERIAATLLDASEGLREALELAPTSLDLRRVASDLYWEVFRHQYDPDSGLSDAEHAALGRALDRFAALGIPLADGGGIEAWLASMRALVADGLGSAREILERIEDLARTVLFGELDGHALRAIAEAVDLLEVPAGHTFFAEGERGDALYVLVAGAVKVEASGLHLTDLLPHACFGEVALIPDVDGGPRVRTASVMATAPSRCYRLSAARFEALVVKHGAIGLGVMKTLASRLAAATAREVSAV